MSAWHSHGHPGRGPALRDRLTVCPGGCRGTTYALGASLCTPRLPRSLQHPFAPAWSLPFPTVCFPTPACADPSSVLGSLNVTFEAANHVSLPRHGPRRRSWSHPISLVLSAPFIHPDHMPPGLRALDLTGPGDSLQTWPVPSHPLPDPVLAPQSTLRGKAREVWKSPVRSRHVPLQAMPRSWLPLL